MVRQQRRMNWDFLLGWLSAVIGAVLIGAPHD